MSNKRILFFALTLGAVALTIPFIGRADNRPAVRQDDATPQSSLTNETKATSTDDEPKVLSFQVTPNGFEPSEVNVSHGKFLMLLQNRTGRRDLTFRLTRENEGRVGNSDPQKRDWKAHVHLNPGTYILDEPSNPEWKSIIRVTN